MKIDSEILCSFMDGELDEARADEVRAAIESDEKLRAEYEALLKTARLVAGLPQVAAPPEVAAGIVAVAEREQLLGVGVEERPKRHGFYWGMSLAASLLVGVAVGILGYHSWPGRSEQHTSSADGGGGVGPAVVSVRKIGPGSTDEEHAAKYMEIITEPEKARTRFGWRSPTQAKDATGSSRGVARGPGEEPADFSKGGFRSSRSGPVHGEPAMSYADGPEGPMPDGELPSKSGPGYLAGSMEERDSDLSPRVAGSFAKSNSAVAKGTIAGADGEGREDSMLESELALGEQKARLRRAADLRNLPLEHQLYSNAGVLNQDMAANLDFQREPFNVKVVSNDSGQTLAYVRGWARRNSLVDLNEAPADMNLPAYTQAVYVGRAVSNNFRPSEEAVLLRTTKRQAVQIVNELQRQGPVIVQVQVQDKNNYLGLADKSEEDGKDAIAQGQAEQMQVQADVLKANGTVMKQEVRAYVPESASSPAAVQASPGPTEETEAFIFGMHGGVGQIDIEGGQKAPQTASEKADYNQQVLVDLGNQAQVWSLDDLVTLVVQVVDARRLSTAPAGSAAPAAQPPGAQQTPNQSGAEE